MYFRKKEIEIGEEEWIGGKEQWTKIGKHGAI